MFLSRYICAIYSSDFEVFRDIKDNLHLHDLRIECEQEAGSTECMECELHTFLKSMMTKPLKSGMRIKRIVVPLEELQRRRNGNIAAEIKAVDELPDAVVDTITGQERKKSKRRDCC